MSTYRDVTLTFRRRVLLFFIFFLTLRVFFCAAISFGKIIQKRHLHARAHTHTQCASSSSSRSITAVHAPRRRRWGSVFIRGRLVLFPYFVLQICASTSTRTSGEALRDEDIVGFDERERE
jgi:hypothetical protein